MVILIYNIRLFKLGGVVIVMWKAVVLGITVGIIVGGFLIYTFWYIACDIMPVIIK
ncbi:MAG: hypothetical protein PHQ32_00545 [Firmicutes bacterium]|nr:hypothetical protein [Bacillota bacterium]